MTSQTLRTIQSVFYGSLPMRQRTPRRAMLRMMRATGGGLVLASAFSLALALSLVGALILGGVLSLG